MWWDQIKQSWRRLFVIVAALRTKPNVNSMRDASNRSEASYSGKYQATPRPYTPETCCERSDFSQHLSC